MRALGLPNTKHFHEITKIADALAREFHPVLCLELSWLTAISTDSGRTSKEGRPAGTESGRTNGGIRGCGGKCVGQLAQLAPLVSDKLSSTQVRQEDLRGSETTRAHLKSLKNRSRILLRALCGVVSKKTRYRCPIMHTSNHI